MSTATQTFPDGNFGAGRHVLLLTLHFWRTALCCFVVPKHFDETVVQDRFGTTVGGLGLGVRRERHQGAFRVPVVRHLQVDNLPEFAEMIVEDRNVVESSRNLLHLQATIRWIKTTLRWLARQLLLLLLSRWIAQSVVIKVALLDDMSILIKKLTLISD